MSANHLDSACGHEKKYKFYHPAIGEWRCAACDDPSGNTAFMQKHPLGKGSTFHMVCGGCGEKLVDGGVCVCCPKCLMKSTLERLEMSQEPQPPRLETDGNTVHHPAHYNQGKIETIEAIEDWKLDFNLGNAVKYIARADHKGKRAEDIQKAIWYLERALGGNRK